MIYRTQIQNRSYTFDSDTGIVANERGQTATLTPRAHAAFALILDLLEKYESQTVAQDAIRNAYDLHFSFWAD